MRRWGRAQPVNRAVEPLFVEGVTVRFAGLTALDDLTYTVEPGSVHALIGPNGAGKSTCFNVLTGVYRATAGRVRLGDTTISGRRPHEITRCGIGRTFQNIALSPHQTVAENLMLARHLITGAGFVSAGMRLPRAMREARTHRRRVEEIAEFVGVADVLDVPAGVLPYGDQKRVELARALCVEPVLLLLDEPVAGLNAEETREMAQIIRDVRDGMGVSVLLVEHDMGLVMGIADRVTVLDFGRLIANGPPAAIQQDPAVIRAYLGTGREDTAELAALARLSHTSAAGSTQGPADTTEAQP